MTFHQVVLNAKLQLKSCINSKSKKKANAFYIFILECLCHCFECVNGSIYNNSNLRFTFTYLCFISCSSFVSVVVAALSRKLMVVPLCISSNSSGSWIMVSIKSSPIAKSLLIFSLQIFNIFFCEFCLLHYCFNRHAAIFQSFG